MKLYAISGLGADKRVFDYLKLNCELIPIDWIIHEKNESIENYAKRLSKVIDINESFGIIGVSFGGLMAMEISKFLKPKITILISSAETRHELPPAIRFFGKIGLIKILPAFIFSPVKSISHLFFKAENKELLNLILGNLDLKFAKWAVNELANWKNEQTLESVVKISGTDDRLIPPTKSQNTVLIEGGKHFMVVDRADEVSEIINIAISSIKE